jgi:hypothetical protein
VVYVQVAADQRQPGDKPVESPATPPAYESFRLTTSRARDIRDDLRELQRLVGWLYTANPFYVISAALVFAGLRLSFDPSASACHAWSLMAGLTAYTLLLAATAWCLIRYGGLWQDVRSLLLLVVLLLLGTSVSFDRSLVERPQLGIPLAVGGLVLAVALSEGLVRGIRLCLPAGFRLPYYAILALFFLYPIGVSHWVREPDRPILQWSMFGFSTVAAVLFLTLLPAVRRGADYVARNGSPWRWPWYPWVLFAALGLAVCWRAYYLCISLHGVVGSRTIFDFYFLVPFLWVVAYLLLEIGVVSGRNVVKNLALLIPLALLPMGLTASPFPRRPDDLGFLRLFHGTLGASPLFLTVLAVAAFYAIAWARGTRLAVLGFLAAVAALSVCGPDTFNDSTTWGPYGWPGLAIGIYLLVSGVLRRWAGCCLIAAWCMVLTLWIDLRDTSLADYCGAIPIHLLVGCMLVVGAVFRDKIGRAIQTLGAAALVVLVAVSLCPPSLIGDPPERLLTFYPLSVACIALVYALLAGNPWYYAAAAGSLCGWLGMFGWSRFSQARRTIAGLDYIAWGALSFLIAIAVSLMKIGVFRRVYHRWRPKS